MGLEVSVSALRVAVVGAEFEVGGEERAGMVAGASENKRETLFWLRFFLGHIVHVSPTIANASSSSHKSTTGERPRREFPERGKKQTFCST